MFTGWEGLYKFLQYRKNFLTMPTGRRAAGLPTRRGGWRQRAHSALNVHWNARGLFANNHAPYMTSMGFIRV